MTRSRIKDTIAVFAMLLATLMTAAPGAEPATGPGVALFDTGTPSTTALDPAALKSRAGWVAVPEDDLTHRYQGNVVAGNDRLAIVLRGKSGGAEVYAHTAAGPRLRLVLAPVAAAGREPPRLTSVKVVENNPGAAALTASFTAADGRDSTLTYRLTAGQPIVELRPGEGVDRLRLQGGSHAVVVPDFFGDDMVFRPADVSRPRLRLPAENFVLNLLGEGDAMAMCVWPSGRQGAVAVRGEKTAAQADVFSGCEIDVAKGKPLWVACLEGKDLWREVPLKTAGSGNMGDGSWQPPFAAKWRADLLGTVAGRHSWWFRLGDEPGEPVSDGNNGNAPVLLYPLDRSQTTPLTVFTPIDVLRNTLGVGPCQYILQTEGLAAAGDPTPDNVMTWVEKQFQRKKEKKAKEEIAQRLDEMVQHLRLAQQRIAHYARLARTVRARCDAQETAPAASVANIRRLADQCVPPAQPAGANVAPAERGQQLADEVLALIGKPDAAAACGQIGAELRAIGAAQDRTLANCRMSARWLKQSALMVGDDDPPLAAWAQSTAAEVDRGLATPQPADHN